MRDYGSPPAPAWQPRNLAAALRARPAEPIVISLIGKTKLPAVHVFVEPDHRYNLTDLAGRPLWIATRAGLNAGFILAAAYALWYANPPAPRDVYPLFVDPSAQAAGELVAIKPLVVWWWAKGSDSWVQLFG